MRKVRSYLCLLILLSFYACKKKQEVPAKAVEIYLLDSFEKVTGQCRIDVATAVIQSVPLINNEDILTYSRTQHNFRVTADAYDRAKLLQDGRGFVVTVNKEIIYYGIYKPSISSSSCAESVTMDAWLPGNSNIGIRLGYPTGNADTFFDDPRENPALLSALEAQGKLTR